MNKEQIYRELQDRMLDYKDYANIPVIDNGERLVPIEPTDELAVKQYRTEMLPYTGEQIYVRFSVALRLGQAASRLTAKDPSLQLEVCYGYRALEIQRTNFEKQKMKLESEYEGEELHAMTHRAVAVPEVAGHPAGAAIDIRIISDGQPLDFGTDIWDFSKDSYTFSPFISDEAKRNRKLLRSVMIPAGFAPYDGEWWHFSYGDKEWARYWDQPIAFYGQLDFNDQT